MNCKKKILIIAASLRIGGAEKVARDIALYAPEDKYEFHYIVFGDEVGAYEAQVIAKGAKVFHWPQPSENYFAFFRNLLSLTKQEGYHAVHAHNMFNCGFTMLAAAMAGVPIRISHSHSALVSHPSFAKQIYEKLMQFLILRFSTNLVACGIAAGKRLFGDRDDVQLILNGIDMAEFAYSSQKRDAIRRELQLEDRFVLGHAGHLAGVKNQAFLLDLMPLILETRPDTKLLLLGEGEDRPMLEQKIRDMNLEDAVIMTGNVPNVADYLSAMDVFVFPSLYEGLPLSILEVQANGLPCIISDGVPRDVFLTDLIQPLSLKYPKEQWVETILKVQRINPVFYNEMLQQSEYTAETAMKKIYHLYTEVFNEN